ncbi:WD repeat-containing protein 31-like [Sinocyclocheilus rhinocerous]|uniref:WD repeat-containing protein 31-like n=1 Tax=Sinocyclocheilus rhinocerous TaxID=307959 RepID=UPI0007B9EDD4|nr:PREDICTED: WD repeat-containing protein 31-like [Sinocyclocheilus rhinocerous]
MGKLQSKFRRRSDLYKAKEGAELAPVHQVVQYEPAHTDAINCVVSLTSDLCVSGGHDQAVVVYDWRAGKQCKSFQGHSREITKLCCFKGSSLIFSASRDKTVLMWDLGRDTEPVQEFCGHELVVNGVAVGPDGSKLCTGSRDNSMRLWDIESGECLQKNTISRNLSHKVVWIICYINVFDLCVGVCLRVWDSRTWQVTNTFPAKQYIQTHCDISSNCYHLLSSSNGFGGQGCEATLWDLRQPGCKVAEYRGHLQTTACCVFVPPRPGCPALVASSSYDSSVKIWDQNTAACLYTLMLDGSGPLVSLAPCDSSSLLCASFNTGLHQLHLDQGAVPSLTEVARF